MIKNLIIHHSGGTDSNPLQDSSHYTLQQCNADHKTRFNMKSSLGWYIGYHYFIDINGIVTQTRKDTEEGAHCKGYNNTAYDRVNFPQNLSIGICLAGNFDATLPNEKQIASLKNLLQLKTKEYSIALSNIRPHRHFAKKSCYGNKLSDTWASELLSTATPITQPVRVETWQDKFHKAMLMAGFTIQNGKYVWKAK